MCCAILIYRKGKGMKEKLFEILTTRADLLDELVKLDDEIEAMRKQFGNQEVDELVVDWILEDNLA
jgi:hypothetical protein